jgi:hypothetical protein
MPKKKAKLVELEQKIDVARRIGEATGDRG